MKPSVRPAKGDGATGVLRADSARPDDLHAMGRLIRAPRADIAIGQARCVVGWLPEARPPFVLRLEFSVGSDTFDLWADDGGVIPELSAEAMAVLSSNARRTCFALALESVLLAVERVLARPVRLVRMEYQRRVDAPPRSVGFELVDTLGATVRHGAISAREDGAWHRLAEVLPEPVELPGGRRPCTLRLGYTRVTVSQWRRLAPDWLILVTRRTVEPRGFTLHDARGVRLAAFSVEPGRVEARRTDGDAAMDLHLLEPDPSDPDRRGEPSLALSFELGTALVALEELDALRIGDIVRLDRPIESRTVRVVCGGVDVGAGVLLELDGQLAVRLTRIGPHG